jgi:MFS family permease
MATEATTRATTEATTRANRELVHIIDNSQLGAFQISIMAVCFVLIALDGFDTQSISFVAPTLREAWSVSPEMFGPLFGAGLFGTLIGSIFLGSLADKFGRKPMLILSTLVFGLMTLACATADSIEQLGTFRFLAGLGLGGAIPNIIALISEYSPKRVRSTAIVMTFTGFPIGAILGGIGSRHLIPHFGWESVFIAGGVLPLLMIPLVMLLVPESARFLASAAHSPACRPQAAHSGQTAVHGRTRCLDHTAVVADVYHLAAGLFPGQLDTIAAGRYRHGPASGHHGRGRAESRWHHRWLRDRPDQ